MWSIRSMEEDIQEEKTTKNSEVQTICKSLTKVFVRLHSKQWPYFKCTHLNTRLWPIYLEFSSTVCRFFFSLAELISSNLDWLVLIRALWDLLFKSHMYVFKCVMRNLINMYKNALLVRIHHTVPRWCDRKCASFTWCSTNKRDKVRGREWMPSIQKQQHQKHWRRPTNWNSFWSPETLYRTHIN